MKKILLVVAVVALLSGCGVKTKTLTCSRKNTINNITSKTTYKIDHEENNVKMLTVVYEYNDNHTDGVGTGTDGTTNDTDTDIDGIVDGVVGKALDDVVMGITDTVLDITGVKNSHNKAFSNYSNTEGFKTVVNNDNGTDYKVTYTYDLTKLSDSDISSLGISRDYETLKRKYTTTGTTCK